MLKLISNKLTILKIHWMEFDLPICFAANALCTWFLLKRMAMVPTTFFDNEPELKIEFKHFWNDLFINPLWLVKLMAQRAPTMAAQQ